ncbi:YcaO-like family protein [Culturomica massiliensis]|uniref:YcaO-like family protein n=1 Tax=Culturomica massiliensis TaxID=1841857 RepID=UPI003AB1DB9E
MMLKPYKEEKPLITVNKIRSVLNELGIFVIEKYKQNGDYFTCRVQIANDNLIGFGIGSNGKGISIEYAYASAYAEFMERLQNNVLIKDSFFFSNYYERKCSFNEQLKFENKKLDFIYCPNEEVVETTKVIDENYDILSKLFLIKDKNELKNFISNTFQYNKVICVPFYNHSNDTVNYLPIDILLQCTGSTGMCAGNTPEEALIQGLSEILERYAMREIYTQRLTPPTIPHDYFREFPVYNLIKRLEEKGLDIIVKDFSLGKNLPVIGIIIIDTKSRKYNVKVGSDPWPITALERCLTEVHQSFSGVRLIDKYDYGEFIQKKYSKLGKEKAEYFNLSKIFDNATGQWPDSIFGDRFSYEFENLNFNLGKSNKSDLEYLIQLIGKLDSQIYIRDVSYLGFNSYYIVVPGLSQDKRDKKEYTFFHELYSLIEKVNEAPLLPKADLSSLVSLLEENYIILKEKYINLENIFYCNTDLDAKDLTIDLFLSMANYKLGNIHNAHLYMDNYLENKDIQDYLYFYACKDYLALLKNGKNDYEIQSYMVKIYGLELSAEVIGDMKDADNIFKSYNLQSYFNSNDCDVKEFKYYEVATLLKNIENKHKLQPIDQMRLSTIFPKKLN